MGWGASAAKVISVSWEDTTGNAPYAMPYMPAVHGAADRAVLAIVDHQRF